MGGKIKQFRGGKTSFEGVKPLDQPPISNLLKTEARFHSGGEGGAKGLLRRTTSSSGFAVIFLLEAEDPFQRVKYTTARMRGIPTPSPTPKPMARVEDDEEVGVVVEVVEVVVEEEEEVFTDTLAVGYEVVMAEERAVVNEVEGEEVTAAMAAAVPPDTEYSTVIAPGFPKARPGWWCVPCTPPKRREVEV